jgi:hypothetical protein
MSITNTNTNNNILILLNEFIIDIINDKKYFNNFEYENIKKINNSCIINEDDCHTSITSKINMQHYIFYFLLEFIKLNISENKIIIILMKILGFKY